MTPHQHPQCNEVLRAPADMPECEDLPIRREGEYVWSFWKPNTEELAALIMGGSVALAVQGTTHPPLSINATTPTEVRQEVLSLDELAVLNETLRARYSALVPVAKKAMSMLAKGTGPSRERDELFERFLDIITINHTTGEVVRGLPVDPEPAATDIERWKADAEGWKAEAERWRKVANGLQTERDRADRLQAAVDSVIDQLNRASVETPNPDQPEG